MGNFAEKFKFRQTCPNPPDSYFDEQYSHSGQSTHFKGWGFEILKKL